MMITGKRFEDFMMRRLVSVLKEAGVKIVV